MRRAKPMRPSRQVKAEHQYAEAFHLMKYQCGTCLYQETIWNSRNGVTPFCVRCPKCGAMDMEHIDWRGDVTDPDHQPKSGERVFVGKPDEPKLVVFQG